MSVVIVFDPVRIKQITEAREKVYNPQTMANLRFSLVSKMKHFDTAKHALFRLGATDAFLHQKRILFKIDGYICELQKNNEDLPYKLNIYSPITAVIAGQLLEEMNNQYESMLQSAVYERIKKNAEEKGLTLENETLQEDQTIVLTYQF